MSGMTREPSATPSTSSGSKRDGGAGEAAPGAAASLVQLLRNTSYDDGAAALSPAREGAVQKRAVQRKPPPMEHAGPGTGPPGENGQAAMGADLPPIQAARDAVDGGDVTVTADPLTLDGDEYRFRFLNPIVQQGLEYILRHWAGESDIKGAMYYRAGQEPSWVKALRYKALQSKELKHAGESQAEPELATKLCDAVEKDPPIRDLDDPRLSQIYKDVYAEAEKRMGTSRAYPLSAAEKDKGRVDLFEAKGGGRVQGTGTSCGLLPGAVMKAGGVMPDLGKGKANLTGSAVMGMRDEAIKIGAWHVAAKTDIPPPGAPYMLSADSAGKNVQHVGIIRATDVPDATHGLVWKTMDAGQGGDGYFADFVTRKVERRDDGVWLIPTLPGQLGDPTKWRKLTGWVDLDKVMAAQQAQIAAAEANQGGDGAGGETARPA